MTVLPTALSDRSSRYTVYPIPPSNVSHPAAVGNTIHPNSNTLRAIYLGSNARPHITIVHKKRLHGLSCVALHSNALYKISAYCMKSIISNCARCCDGGSCHFKSQMTPGMMRRMSDANDRYHALDDRVVVARGEDGVVGEYPGRAVIRARLKRYGMKRLEEDITTLNQIISARQEWLSDWYKRECYTCDANGRDHEGRIRQAERALNMYDDIISITSSISNTVPDTGRKKLMLLPKSRIHRSKSMSPIKRIRPVITTRRRIGSRSRSKSRSKSLSKSRSNTRPKLKLLPRSKPTGPRTPPRKSYITTPNHVWRSPRRQMRPNTSGLRVTRVTHPSPMRARTRARTRKRFMR